MYVTLQDTTVLVPVRKLKKFPRYVILEMNIDEPLQQSFSNSFCCYGFFLNLSKLQKGDLKWHKELDKKLNHYITYSPSHLKRIPLHLWGNNRSWKVQYKGRNRIRREKYNT